MADWSAAVDDPAVQSELRAALEAAIAELPVAHRAIILLHDVEGVRMADVAVSLGITLASAKTRAHRARLLLRKRLANFMSEADVGDARGAAVRLRYERLPSSTTRPRMRTWEIL
jgi:DNA-directed RNA polymerase specialized sigma24 family protein